MADKVLMKGNEAIGEAAIRAGVKAYYGYPITPQTELTSYMGANMPVKGRVFIQTESEIGAINGAIARLGAEHDIPTPVNGTLALLVRAFEAGAAARVS